MKLTKALVLTAFLAVTANSFADDSIARQKLAEAKTLYTERATPAKLDEAIAALAVAEKEAQDADLKYDVLIFTARAVYFKGLRATVKEAKIALFDQSLAKADLAKAVNEDWADAHY